MPGAGKFLHLLRFRSVFMPGSQLQGFGVPGKSIIVRQGHINTMLVGHLPFMDRMASYLVTGSTDTPVFKFQNSGIVCLNKNPDTDSWVIVWTLIPNIG